MNLKALATVSVLALLAVSPAIAEDVKTDSTTTKTIQQNIKKGWENTKEAVSEAASDVDTASRDAYEEVKYTFFGNEVPDSGVVITVNPQATARGMLGGPVVNTKGERIGTLRDIILDNGGQAVIAVVSDARFIDVGAKEAAFDYALVMRQNQNGDIVMPLTEEVIENARSFSYEAATGENIVTPPADGYSVEELMDAEILNDNGNTVAHVDNIVFRNGRADNLIVGFDKVLGMGGEKAALAFADVRAVREVDDDSDDYGDDVDFQLTAAQSARFETFKGSVSN